MILKKPKTPRVSRGFLKDNPCAGTLSARGERGLKTKSGSDPRWIFGGVFAGVLLIGTLIAICAVTVWKSDGDDDSGGKNLRRNICAANDV